MLTGSKLRRINDRPRRVNRLLLLAVGGGSVALAALLYALLALPMLAPVALLAGVLGLVGVYRAHKANAITSVSYEGKLDVGAAARFSEVSEALEALASSEKLWHLTGPAPRSPKAGEASPTPEREPARAGLLKTPGIRSDVPIWGLEAGEQSIFFFPEGALLYEKDRYEPLRYDLLKVAISTAPFYEKEAVPGDAKVAAEASARLGRPVVLHSLLEIGLPGGRGMRLQVSSRQAAARFARAFGVESRKSPREWEQEQGQEHPQGQSQRSSEGSEEKAESVGSARHDDPFDTEAGARVASAYATLDVSSGASAEQIVAAYRKLARAHHPDKVANEPSQVREESERRMKEINAAYSLLKLQGPGSAEGERVG